MIKLLYSCLHSTRIICSTCFALSLLSVSLGVNARQTAATASADTVLVGYGTQKRSAVTGAVTTLRQEQFNQGLIVSPGQLITGQVAGLQLTDTDGSPGAGSVFRLQRMATLAAENAPLIVLDGVMLDAEAMEGLTSPMSLLNPTDIASVTVLKDAAATGIYGSRGVNGVILITTKRGMPGSKMKVDFRSRFALSTLPAKVPLLSAAEFRQAVQEWGTQKQKEQLGSANTDWQDEIYNNAVSHDQNLSLGGTVGSLPYRLSLGYLNQQGILRNTSFARKSSALTLHPSLLDNHLKINLSLKGILSESQSASKGLISQAVRFDPTQPVYTGNGDYFEWRDANGNPDLFAPSNPVGLLENRPSGNEGRRGFGNMHVDYSFHFLPALHAHLNLGYDVYKGEGKEDPHLYNVDASLHRIEQFGQTKKNKLKEYYLTFSDSLEKWQSQLQLTAGYTSQILSNETFATTTYTADGSAGRSYTRSSSHGEDAFFGRFHYGLKDRYFLTASVRRDGTARLANPNKHFTARAAGISWRISEESFLKSPDFLSGLTIRAGYGIQRNLPMLSNNRPSGSSTNPNVMWDMDLRLEETATLNFGLDFSLFSNRAGGSLEYFSRQTHDLFSYSVLPWQGSSSYILQNNGGLETNGWEASLHATILDSDKVNWLIEFNGSYASNKLTHIQPGTHGSLAFHNPGYSTFFVNSPGAPINSFLVYQQEYQNGSPVDGQFKDINRDDRVDFNDRRPYQSARPKSLLGFNSHLTYKKWSFSFLARAEAGNYLYNSEAATGGYYWPAGNSRLNNLSSSVLETGFSSSRFLSDYYVQNASFLRLEYSSLGYDFGNILQGKAALRLGVAVQNAFVLTGYSGQDPEVLHGIDEARYPRPRTYSLSMHVTL